MNLVKCPNGHFYDGNRFSECPHCIQTESALTEPLTDPAHAQEVEVKKQEVHKKMQFSGAGMDDDARTVGVYQKIIGVEPVVGWLVCIEGEYFGESFNLRSGKNFIGRASDMDIVLGLDKSVSRNRHACVVYEPRSRVFIAQPGESRELFYLNDEVVLNNVKMSSNDVLLIGETKLMLIPCCSEKFSWDDVTKK